VTVDSIDDKQAREHIEMVERILVESSQRLCYGAEYFIVWGVYSAAATVSWSLIRSGALPFTAVWGQVGLLVAAIVFTIVRSRTTRGQEQRRSLVQREFFNMLWLTMSLAFIVNVGAFNIFSHWAAAAIWSFAEAIVLLFIGLHGNRRAQICGVLVVVSIVIANFTAPGLTGYVLAAGMLAGYGGFGIAELFAGE
jgi:hypothetical protein